MSTLVALQVASTLSLVGLIWFVQVVHYPMLRDRGAGSYPQKHAEHAARTGRVVVPLMLVELFTAVLLVVYGDPSILGLARAGLILVGLAWTSTFLIQVPLHRVLTRGWNADAHRRLVRGNWVRTGAWTARGFLVLWLALGAAGSGSGAARDVAPAASERDVETAPPPALQQQQRPLQAPPVLFSA
jgi:hypothetical protein